MLLVCDHEFHEMLFILGTAELHQNSGALLEYAGPHDLVDIGQMIFIQKPDDIGVELFGGPASSRTAR